MSDPEPTNGTAVETLYCQNCHYQRRRRRRDRVSKFGWGAKCPACKEEHLQLKKGSFQ